MDDTDEDINTHKFTIGDYNVALNPDTDTVRYLHINSRVILTRKINLCNLAHYPMRRKYTFNKKQAKNYTRARLDYFLVGENSTEIVKDVLIGCVCRLSDHRPIHLQLSFSKVQKGKGFWRMRNELLTNFEYITGCNEVIKDTFTQYSGHLRQLELSTIPSNEQYCNAPYDLNYSLLHDVVLMEVRSYTMKYEAIKRRNKKDEKDRLENEIDKIQKQPMMKKLRS